MDKPKQPRPATTAAQRALQALQQAIRTAEEHNNPRLPTIKALAASAGVSLVTMWKQVRTLATAGELSAHPQQGVLVTRLSSEKKHPQVAIKRRIGDVVELIRQAAATGEFHAGTALPPAKALASLYGVSNPTVFRALASLINEGTVVRQGHRYSLPRRDSRRGGVGRVVLVVAGSADGRMQVVTPRTINHLQAAERACASRGLALDVVTNVQLMDSLAFGASRAAQRWVESLYAKDVVGYGIWSVGFPDDGFIAQVADYCTKQHRAVALLEETRDDSTSRLFPLPHVKTFALDVGEGAGYQVGCHLRRLGHRRVAFVYPGVETDAIGRRGTGMLRALRQGFGAQASVVAMHSGETMNMPAEQKQMTELVDMLRQHTGPALHKRLGLEQQDTSLLSSRLWALITEIDFEQRSKQLAHEALMHTEATAIVGGNDRTAAAVLTLLREQDRPVPGMVSVIGFDNGMDAFAQQLTTYDFGGSAAVGAMIDYLANPVRSPFARTPIAEVTAMKGAVVTRRTTAAVTR